MATIPLPALHTAPIQQPQSPLETYAQVLGIQNQQQQIQQRQALSPLQQQEAQNAVASGNIDLQAKQLCACLAARARAFALRALRPPPRCAPQSA